MVLPGPSRRACWCGTHTTAQPVGEAMPRYPSTLLALVLLAALPIATLWAQQTAPNADSVDAARAPVQAAGVIPIRRAAGRGIWMNTVRSPVHSTSERPWPLQGADGSDHRGRNVLIGMGVGAAVGGILASTSCDDDCTFSVGMVIAPLGGAAIGALVALLLTPVR